METKTGTSVGGQTPSDHSRSQTPDQGLDEQLVDALNALFGVHPGFRPVHAKGIMCEGTFTPASTASAFSRAPHFQSGSVPVTVRFSNFVGIPTAPDNDPNASPRGMAIRFHLPNGAETDIVAHSVNGFPARTPEDFLAFLRALASSGPDAPQPSPIEQFLGAHPQALRFVTTPKPEPASYATEAYYGVNAFRFTNRSGESRYGRYQVLPVAGKQYLEADEGAKRPANFLFGELGERLSQGPAAFRLVVQLAGESDPVDDASLSWPDERPQAELGTLSVTGIRADSDAAQRAFIFDPMRLVDGIEPSNDPILRARPGIYSVSYARRNQ